MENSLRARREALGLTALEMAGLAGCTVDVVLRAEFGLHVPHNRFILARLAAAYGLSGDAYVRLALDAADRAGGSPRMRFPDHGGADLEAFSARRESALNGCAAATPSPRAPPTPS